MLPGGREEGLWGRAGAGLFLLTGHGIPDIFMRIPAGPVSGTTENYASININPFFFVNVIGRNTARWANFSRNSRTRWPG